MKLRKHRRVSSKLAAKATANRKAVSSGQLSYRERERNGSEATASKLAPEARTPRGKDRNGKDSKTVLANRPSFKFRVEFWKEEPEIRIGHGQVTLYQGDQL